MVSGAGQRPASGARFVLERTGPIAAEAAAAAESESRELKYKGFIHLPDEDVAVEVKVELPSGATRGVLEGGEGSERDKELARMAAAFVRSATKGGAATGGPFPRKIVRWR
jgi:hypothetical protein